MEKENQEINRKKSGRNKQEWVIIYGVILLFAVLSLFFSHENLVSSGINLLILVAMLFFLTWGMGKTKSASTGTTFLNDCTDDLLWLQEFLEESEKEHPGESWECFREKEDWEFFSPALKEAIEKMNNECDSLSDIGDDGGYQCDLADYVNEDLLLTVGNAHFNDFVSNAMTGLGILGTFVGLVLGLRTFDATSAEAMTNSIVPLIDGMKVAFLTSIFGVFLSLLYGSLYRRDMRKAQEALDAFLDTYYASQGRRPENNTMSKLLSYEKSQAESMNQFSETISVALSDALQTTFSPTLADLPNQIAKAIEENVLPAINQMKDGFEAMSGKMAEQMAQTQSEGVGVIVDKFVTQMDAMVGGQMENLGKSIETICNWQEQTIQHLNEAVDGICKNTETVTGINDQLQVAVEKMSGFADQIGAAEAQYQETSAKSAETLVSTAESVKEISTQAAETLGKAADSVEQTGNEMAEITERSGEIMKNVNTIVQSISQQEAQMKQMLEDQIQSLQSMKTITAQYIQQMQESCTTVTTQFEESAGHMTASAENLNNQWTAVLERSFAQFDKELAVALQHFSGTLADLQEIVERSPGLVDSSISKMQKETSKYLQTMSDYQKQLGQTVSGSVAAVEKHISAVEKQASAMERHAANIEKQTHPHTNA